MFEIIVNTIIGIIMTIIHVYIWTVVLNKKINFKKIKTYFLLTFMTFLIVFNYIYINKYLRIAFITFAFMLFCKFLFKVSSNKAILAPIVSQIVIAFSEFLFALIFLTIIDIDGYKIFNTYVGTLFPNVMIALIAFAITKTGLIKKTYLWLLKITSKTKKYDLLIFIFILIITINLIQVNIYYKVDLRILIVINIGLMITYALIILKLTNVKNDYLIISSKYSTSIKSLRENESVIERYRIDNHENKNQLMTLKGKINKDNNEAIKYIDMILDTRIKENTKILKSVNVIPEGGLRGLIYSKMLLMESEGIKCNLYVDKIIKTLDIIELGDRMLDDICKVLGVYLDNAIEASYDIDDKIILINLYKENDFINVSIMNNFKGEIDFNKINIAKYTTKGKGKGYGLTLVDKILENNNKLSKQTLINNGTFKQVLKIKFAD